MDDAAMRQAITDGVREGMREMLPELSRAIADAMQNQTQGIDVDQESVLEQRVGDVRDTLDRFEILLETIESNTRQALNDGV